MSNTVTAHPRRWPVLAIMAVCVFIATMDSTILTVALADIQRQLNASNSQLQWVRDSYTITFAALLFTAGLLGDKLGRKRVMITGLVLFAITSTFAAYAADPTQLILARAVMGVGMAVVPGISLAVISNVFPAHERDQAISLWSVGGGLAIALGPVIGGLLLKWFWWGSALLINVPLVVLVLIAVVALVPESRNPVAERLDLAGVTLSGLSVGLMVFGIIRGGELGEWMALSVAGPIACAAALLVLLVFVESRVQNPALDLALFRNRRFSSAAGALSLGMLVVMGGSYILIFYVQVLRDRTPLVAGLLMLPMALGTMVAAGASPKIAGRFGVGPVVSGGLVVVALSLTAFAALTTDTSLILFELIQAAFGVGTGLVVSLTPAVCMEVVPADKAGAGAAIPNMLQQIGAAVGIAILGSVLGVAYQHRISPAVQALPAQVRVEAAASIGGTMLALQNVQVSTTELSGNVAAGDHDATVRLQQLQPAVRAMPTVVAQARSAFISAQRIAMWTAAVIAAVAAVLTAVGLRRTRDSGETAAHSRPEPHVVSV